MAKHPRIRRVAKWTGLVACVLIVVVWAVSLRKTLGFVGYDWVAGTTDGWIVVVSDPACPFGQEGWYQSAAGSNDFGFGCPSIGLPDYPHNVSAVFIPF